MEKRIETSGRPGLARRAGGATALCRATAELAKQFIVLLVSRLFRGLAGQHARTTQMFHYREKIL